jgi:tetratricopeptide (TPR) repeat protein
MLARDAIYTGLAPELRREYHRLLALHLEDRGTAGGDERIGTHWERAGDRQRALPYLLQAARQAALRQEIVRAIGLSHRAGMIPGRIETSHAHQHSNVLRAVAWRYADAGRREEQDALYDVLLRAAEEFDDEELRLKTTVERSFCHFYTEGPSGVELELVREAAEKLPPSRSLAWAHYLQGVVAKHGGELVPAKDHFENAERVSAAHRMLGEQSSALDQLGSVAYRQGRVQEAEELYDRAAELSMRAGRRTNATISQVNRALAMNSRGAYDEFESTLEEAIRTLKLEGAKEHAAHALLNLAEARFARSNLKDARPVVDEALQLLEGSSYLHVVVWGIGMKALFLAIGGDLPRARVELATARELAEKSQDARSQLRVRSFEIYIDCWAGRPAAELALETIDGLARTADPRSRAEFVSRLAECLFYALPEELVDSARELLADDSYSDLARTLVSAARFVYGTGPDPGGDAVRALTAPVVDHQRSVTEILGRLLLVEQLRRSGKSSEAGDELSRAMHCATELGHVWLQAALLVYQQDRLGDDTDSQRRALLGPVAARIAEPDARDELARSWGIRPG